MKLVRRHYYTLREFFRSSRTYYFDITEKELTRGGVFHYYRQDPKSEYSPIFGVSTGKYRRIVFPSSQIIARSTATLIREVFRGGIAVKDTNGELYYSTPGLITDHNFVPIIYVEVNRKHPSKTRCVINSYVFRRENILCKFIIDTLLPLLMNPSYRKSLFEDENTETLTPYNTEIEVVFKDITVDFWKTPSFGMELDKEKIANFTEQFCNKMKLTR